MHYIDNYNNDESERRQYNYRSHVNWRDRDKERNNNRHHSSNYKKEDNKSSQYILQKVKAMFTIKLV